MTDDDFDSGQWDALFGGDDGTRVVRPGSARSLSITVQDLCKVPGVKGAVQVALDGVLQAHAVDGSPEQISAMTAYLGATARQVAATLSYQTFDHALLSYVAEGDPVMIFRSGSSFFGLALEADIAASHIFARIHGRRGA